MVTIHTKNNTEIKPWGEGVWEEMSSGKCLREKCSMNITGKHFIRSNFQLMEISLLDWYEYYFSNRCPHNSYHNIIKRVFKMN